MKNMKVLRGTARALRRRTGGWPSMAAPSATAQAAMAAAMAADQRRAVRKLGVLLFHKAGAGVA
jgi:hypothetical protein